MKPLEITAFSPVTGAARRLDEHALADILALLDAFAQARARADLHQGLFERFAELGLDPAWYDQPARKSRPLFFARQDGHERAGYTLRSLADACAAAKAGRFAAWAEASEDPALLFVVDDDDAFRETLAYMLRAKGYATDLFAGGTEALAHLDALSARKPRLILLDMLMPGLGGVETARELRHRHPEVPLILMTARRLDEAAVEELKADGTVAGFSGKPVEMAKLLALIAQLLEARPA